MSTSATPPEGPPPPSTGGGPERLFAWLRGLGLRRDTSDRWVAGVCSGIAARLGVDPLVVRAATLVLLLLGGLGVALYALAWVFLPTRDGRIRAEEALRGDVGSIVLLVVVALLVVGEVTDRSHPWLLLPLAASIWILYHKWGGGCGSTASTSPRSAGQTSMTSAPTTESGPLADPAATAPPAPGGVPSPAPHGMGPGRTWAATTPPPAAPAARPALPARRRRPGIGVLGVLVVVGSAVLAYGLAAASGATARPVAFGLVCVVGTLGLALLVVGLLGRRAPGLAALGIAAAAAAALAVAVPSSVSFSALRGGGMGEVTWNPTPDTSDTVLRWGAGDATLDLSAFPAPAPGSAPLSASVGLGELVVVVPPGRTVEVDATVGAGEITRRSGSPEGATTFRSEGTDLHERVLVGSGPPDTRVSANVGLGEITVVTP